MHFLPTDEQTELQEAVRSLCTDLFPPERLGERKRDLDRALWQQLAEMGVFSLRVGEDRGGVGLGLPEAVLVFEELGRFLVPGPLVATHLAAALELPAGGRQPVVGLLEVGDGPPVVEHLAALDTLLVVEGERLTAADPARLEGGTGVPRPLDPWTPLHTLTAVPAGPEVLVGESVAAWRREGATLTAAYQLGIAAAVVERTLRYVREREQFGRPVGSFQAVKHQAADMAVRVELARAAVHAAAVTLDDPTVGDPVRAASVAKLLAGRAATGNARTAVQLHGGMGFAWEVDIHYFLKRAWLLDTTWGDGDTHAETVAGRL